MKNSLLVVNVKKGTNNLTSKKLSEIITDLMQEELDDTLVEELAFTCKTIVSRKLRADSEYIVVKILSKNSCVFVSGIRSTKIELP